MRSSPRRGRTLARGISSRSAARQKRPPVRGGGAAPSPAADPALVGAQLAWSEATLAGGRARYRALRPERGRGSTRAALPVLGTQYELDRRSVKARPRSRSVRARSRTDAATLAIAAARWHARARLRGRILDGLAALARTMVEAHDVHAYLEKLCTTVADVLEVPQVCVWQLDAGGRHQVLVAEARPADVAPNRLARNSGLAGRVLAKGEPLELLDVQANPAFRARAAAEGVVVPHYMGVPLQLDSGPLGVLAVHSGARMPLGPDEREALVLFGEQASLAIDHMRLLDTLGQQAAETDRLYRIGRQLARSLELGEVLPQVAAAARAALGADRAVVLLLNADGVTLRQAAVDGRLLPVDQVDRPRGLGLWDRVLTTRRPVVVQDVKRTPGVWRHLTDPAGICSFVHVPIQFEDTAIGILNCSWTRAGAVPPEAESRLGALADQAAVAIRNAQLYAEVSAARDRLDAIWRHAGQPIMVLDHDGGVTAWNPAAEALFDVAPTGYPASPVPPAEWSRLWDLLQHNAGADPIQAEFLASGKDGSPLPVLTTVAPLHDAAGHATAVVLVVTDLRDQKRQEAEHVQAERLRALGELAAGVAHDFNNALAHIVGRAELLQLDHGHWSPTLREGLELVSRAAMDAGATVRRILDFARERPERPMTQVNLNDVVSDVAMLTSPLWRAMAQARAVPLHLELALGAPPSILGDPAELREALINLIHNGVAAMPGGGTLTLATGVEGGRAFLSVQDTGTGMDAATQARIFEPFFTTKGEQGSGLGLSMVYGTLRRHRGDITVRSAPQAGSTFTLWFPIAEGPDGSLSGGATGDVVDQRRILVVDNEPTLATMLTRMLMCDGHEVATCASGAQALEYCRRSRFDLVLTDISMPEMNGWDLARALHTHLPDVPIAFITGWGQHLDTTEMAAAGVRSVLAKPFRREDLQRLVADVPAPR